MSGQTRRAAGGWLGLLAFAGLLIGHFAAYAVVVPDQGMRAALLEATGHGAHGLFVPLAGAALLGAAIGLIAHQLRSHVSAPGKQWSPMRVGLTLWLLQTTAFIALEASERVLSSHAVSELLHEPAFLAGLALQAIVALAGAILVVLLRVTVAALCRYLFPRPVAATRTTLRDPEVFPVPRSLARSAWNLRGPPVSTVT